MKRITVYLALQQITALQAIMELTGLPFAEMLRRVIDLGLQAYNESTYRNSSKN